MKDKKHHHHHHNGQPCDGHHDHDHNHSHDEHDHESVEDNVTSIELESRQKLEEQLNKAEQDAQKYSEMCLRLQAEIQNLQRRSEQNLEKAHKFGLEKFAESLLPVVDSLEMALENLSKQENAPQLASIKEGNELTLKILMDTLKKFNIEQIDPVKKPFDPSFHEAIMMQESNAVPPNTILKVVQKGYLLNGRVLRPARVIIAKEPAMG